MIEINILAAAADFTRCHLQQNQGCHKCSLPAYSIAIDEFRSHFRMAKDTTEALCKQVQTTGRVPQRQSFGKPTILLEKTLFGVRVVHYELLCKKTEPPS